MAVEKTTKLQSISERLLCVLQSKTPNFIPFIDRMNIWFNAKRIADEMPKEYSGLSLDDIHEMVGMGQMRFFPVFAHRLNSVEMVVTFNGEEVIREQDPVYTYFPCGDTPDFVNRNGVGVTHVEFIAKSGHLSVEWEVTERMVVAAIEPYLRKHLISEINDVFVAEEILDNTECIPLFDSFVNESRKMNKNSFLIPLLMRIPFQQLLLEYFGEVQLFFALQDYQSEVLRLLERIDDIVTDSMHKLKELKVPYVEFSDNIDGVMTNPNLFEQFCLPAYRKYTEILHRQDKKVGSHMDGNLGPLLLPIRDCGLDVIESVCPAPLTVVTIEEIWEAWKDGGPIIWGGIPSSLLEKRTSEEAFHKYIDKLVKMVGSKPIIFGVSDMVVGENLIDRIEYIANVVANNPLHKVDQ